FPLCDNLTAPTDSPTPSLHDALPIFERHRFEARKLRRAERLQRAHAGVREAEARDRAERRHEKRFGQQLADDAAVAGAECGADRSEEHTSELQSRVDLVCRLLLEKKK